MHWGKSEDEKRVEAADKERQQAQWQAEQERLRAELVRKNYPSTPLSRAETAMQNGSRFFQLILPVSELAGTDSSFGSSSNEIRSSDGASDLLGQIEDLGWRLEHVGYAFVETGSTSTNSFLSTGQGTVTKGQVQGIYLFRNTRTFTSAS